MSKGLIIIANSHRINIKLYHRYLETDGYEVVEVYDGVECLEKVAELKAEDRKINLIFIDALLMPRMDGYALVKKIRELYGDEIPIVVVTALNDVENQLKAIKAGADDFLSKPVEEKLFLAKAKIFTDLTKCREKLSILFKILNNEPPFELIYEFRLELQSRGIDLYS